MKKPIIIVAILLLSLSSFAVVKAGPVMFWLKDESVSRFFGTSVHLSNGPLILIGLALLAGIISLGVLGARAELKREENRKLMMREKYRASRAA
ncbi:MAG: hypothetical protein H6581_16040 [Bacteroidia bacterium]|nr:hypothetical protein [Bacteroidia bacterium]